MQACELVSKKKRGDGPMTVGVLNFNFLKMLVHLSEILSDLHI